MEICIFQTGEPLHIDKGSYRPMRCMLLADKLLKNGHKVTIISSAFFHQRKIHRSRNYKSIEINKNFFIHLIPSIGYKKHIGLLRIIDHIFLAFNLHLFLRNNRNFNPDRVFLGYPPIITAFVIARWTRLKKIPLILDVKDKWPETFIEPFPIIFKPLARIIFRPYFILAKYIFKKANKTSTISEGFIYWIRDFINDHNSEKYFLSPLTREPILISERNFNKINNYWKEKNINIKDDQYFCFVGSYSRSFNFDLVFDLSEKLLYKFPFIKIILCGSGDKYENLIKKFSSLQNVFIFGEVDQFNSAILIKNALATLAPYHKNINFNDHIPNKVIESLEHGTPFITTLDGTLKKIINENKNGIFISSNKNLNIDPIEKLIKDKIYRENLRRNALKSYVNLFNFDIVYDNIIKNLININ